MFDCFKRSTHLLKQQINWVTSCISSVSKILILHKSWKRKMLSGRDQQRLSLFGSKVISFHFVGAPFWDSRPRVSSKPSRLRFHTGWQEIERSSQAEEGAPPRLSSRRGCRLRDRSTGSSPEEVTHLTLHSVLREMSLQRLAAVSLHFRC